MHNFRLKTAGMERYAVIIVARLQSYIAYIAESILSCIGPVKGM
jgi:hypothetical protein